MDIVAHIEPQAAGRRRFADVFWNPVEGRLRAGWRVLLQMVLVAGIIFGLYYTGFYTAGKNLHGRAALAGVSVTLIVVPLLARWVDKRRFSDYGVLLRQRRWWADYGVGFGAGLLAACVQVGLLVALGWSVVVPSASLRGMGLAAVGALIISVLTYAGVGLFEELLRGYQLRNLSEGLARTRLGLRGGMLLALTGAVLWSVVMHVPSDNGPGFLLFVAFVGVVQGLPFLWTGRVGLAMAYHFAWDFTLSVPLLLTTTASSSDRAFFLVLTNGVPEWAWGLGLPLLGILANVVGLLVMMWWVRRQEGQVRFQERLAVPSLRE